MAFELCTLSGSIVKAGEGANQTILLSEAALERFYDDAEGDLIARTRRDWTDESKTNASVKKSISSVLESEIAKKIINYDPNSWALGTTKAKVVVLQEVIDSTMSRLVEDEVNDIRSVE